METESEKELVVAEPSESETVDTQEQKQTTEESKEAQEFSETKETEETSDKKDENSEEPKEEAKTEESSEEKEEQTSDDNAKFAQIRRKAEEDAKKKIEAETRKAYEKGKLEAYEGKVNPYTEKPITDLADIEMYEAMYKLDNEGKDPLKDLPEELARKRREEVKAIQDKKELEEKTQKEIDEFNTKYPDVDLGELLKDSFFNDYIQGKTKPLTELYEGFNNFKTAFRNSAVDVAKQTIANAQASPGSLGSEAEVVIDYSTMSSEEFAKHVQRVKDGEEK